MILAFSVFRCLIASTAKTGTCAVEMSYYRAIPVRRWFPTLHITIFVAIRSTDACMYCVGEDVRSALQDVLVISFHCQPVPECTVSVNNRFDTPLVIMFEIRSDEYER